MPHIRKSLTLDTMSYYRTHLSLVNCILPVKMTPMEVEVMASFMSLSGELEYHRFGPTAKKVIMARLKLSNGGLSNYIIKLKKKGFLVKTGDILSIIPLLHPDENQQLYQFRLINNKEINSEETNHISIQEPEQEPEPIEDEA